MERKRGQSYTLITLTSLHLQERANIMRFASFVDGIFRFCVAIELTSYYIHVLHIANQTGPCYTREFEFLKRAKSATYRALSGDMGEYLVKCQERQVSLC